jgi:hypothetical protein
MENNTDQQNYTHFPEDHDAPALIQKKSFLREFYDNYQRPVDYSVFAFISISTLVTVSLSIYIISVKYF